MRYSVFLTGLLVAMAISPTINSYAQSMHLQANQTAPDFLVPDAHDKPVSLRLLQGKKVLLSFQRFVGCPICNVRMHELMSTYDSLSKQNVEMIVVYESSKENLRKYLDDTSLPFRMIADPDAKLYALYGVGHSMGKVMRGMMNGAIKKAKLGEKLYKRKLKRDGTMSRIEADFLINPDGTIATAHYDRYLGDDLPLATIRAFAAQ